jgi:Fic family protein
MQDDYRIRLNFLPVEGPLPAFRVFRKPRSRFDLRPDEQTASYSFAKGGNADERDFYWVTAAPAEGFIEYRKALDLIHSKGAALPATEETIRRLHSVSRGGIGDAGKYKRKENNIIEVHPGGRRQVRFRTVRPADTPAAMAELVERWQSVLAERTVHPLVALGAFNLDFLCIHPFRDGNGRVSRLLLLLQTYHLGFEVGRYISLERLIEETKERYYETLKLSSAGWHEAKNDPWPYINYLLYTLLDASRTFERRVGEMASPRGEKSGMIKAAIQRATGPFTIGDLQRACPGVSVDMIRHVLKELKDAGKVECVTRGRNARWRGR